MVGFGTEGIESELNHQTVSLLLYPKHVYLMTDISK